MTAEKPPTDIAEKLATLQQRYYEQLPAKIAEIEQQWSSYLSTQSVSELSDLHRFAHSLTGSAGTFGVPTLSRAARELDDFLKISLDKLDHEEQLDSEASEMIDRMVYYIKEQAEIAIHAKHQDYQQINIQTFEQASIPNNDIVYVVDDDELVSTQVQTVLESSGFKVKTFNTTEDFLQACDEKLPSIIVMDIIFPDSKDSGVVAIEQLKQHHPQLPPVVFISVQGNIDNRLAAMRVGASRFLNKPLDYNKLSTTIHNLSERRKNQEYRVLVVDDSVVMSEYYATVLSAVGIRTRIINNPLTILDVLEEFSPDLILMDLYMPECNGIELASVIRQDDNYIHTSLVFLSTEKSTDIQLKAIEVGADDFITKPAMPEYLISKIMSRVKRTRWLNQVHEDLSSALRKNRYQQTALDSHSIVSITNASGDIVYVNDKFMQISGYTRAELINNNHRVIKSDFHPDQFYQDMWKTISSGKIWNGEIKNRRKNGTYYWVESTIVPFMDDDGLPYQYISIRTDITPLMKIQDELFDAKERAEAASRAKTDFLSSMSHELRTPMNAILGFAQIMLMDDVTELQKDNLDEIINAGHHLMDMINQILDLAHIESDKLSISMEPVFLCDVIDETIGLVSPLVNEKNISLTVDKPEEKNIIVTADRLRFKQVMINLLSNAIKYNVRNGKIHLYCNINEGNIRLHIRDTGIGIANNDINKLFKPFTRLVQNTYGAEGTGIGLVITRRLIERMGGKIGVESEEGEGSTFWIEMPLDKYVSGNPTAVDKDKKLSGNQLNNIEPEEKPVYTVLYIEDNPVNMMLIDKIISRLDNFTLLKAFTPEEGIALAAQHKVDLFLLDINLPGMNGYELLNYFRNQEDTQRVKAIALSANAMTSDVEKGMDSGFDDYITKPISVDRFIATLNAVIN